MIEIAFLIELSASLFGILAICAPVISVIGKARRPKGRSSGTAASSRSWLGVILMAAGLLGMGVLLWHPILLPLPAGMSRLLTIIGALFYFPAVSLYLWSLVTLRSQFGVSGLLGAELYEDHELITSGPFGIIRNPMYAGVLLAAGGAFLIFRTFAMTLFLPMSLVVIARAEREEKLLEAECGDAWRSYAAKVPKWFPRL